MNEKLFTKLFLYAFANGIEIYNDSKGALKTIDDILNTHEEIHWKNLLESIEQSKRVILLQREEKGLSIDDLLTPAIEMDNLKKLVTIEINKRLMK